MSDMVERVARAMFESLRGKTHSGAWKIGEPGDVYADEEFRELFRGMAIAAIAAMREPTEAMFHAWDNEWILHPSETAWKRAYTAMIDAALDPARRDGST